jgi:hypothetical protein
MSFLVWILFEPVERLQHNVFEKRGLETPLAKWIRKFSYSHWVVGSLLQVLPLILLLEILFNVISDWN